MSLAGNLWAIHGGGFYYVEKYKVAPKEIPETPALVQVRSVFHMAQWVLADVHRVLRRCKSVHDRPHRCGPFNTASIGHRHRFHGAGLAIYDAMSGSRLVLRQDLLALVGVVVLGASRSYSHLLSGRSVHPRGALLGTIMAGNVFFTIIPSQKALVRAAKTGQPLDATPAKRPDSAACTTTTSPCRWSSSCSAITSPSTFGHSGNWSILMGIMVASAGIKHYWNLLERGIKRTWVLK
ncbi:MAG: urate hydroxylase PuuD [Flavobacteriales bacterium]|nr:urate hydroxylase PuuD [Flavobacteriales bacterium]